MPEGIRLFALCSAMEWAHLPNEGGLYDQDPEFIDAVTILFVARARHDEEERLKEKRKNGELWKPGDPQH